MVATTERDRTTQFDVTLDGQQLERIDVHLPDALEEIVIDENLHLPSMMSMRLHVNDMDWLSHGKLAPGVKVEVAANEGGEQVPLFTGHITAVEFDMDEAHPVLTLRAYDLSFKLHRIHHRRSFIQVTDSDIAQRIAGEAGLRPQIDSTTEVYPYLYQNNQSDYEFLKERARHIGYDFFCTNTTLYFVRPHQAQGAPIELELGRGLRRFRVRSSIFEPANQVMVRGWDYKSKKEIVGKATRPEGLTALADGTQGAQVAQRGWGQTDYIVTDQSVDSQGEADRLASSYLDELGGSYIEAEGSCMGNAHIRPRRSVKIKGVGATHSMDYYLTAVRHVFATATGHQTTFTASSRRAGTLDEMITGTRPQPAWPGPMVGIVTNINDPEKMGRIKVKLPWLADDAESHWARIAAPLAGKERGFYFLPEVNDEVLVMFEQGDMRRPVIVGNLWNGKELPPTPPSLPRGRDQEILKGDSQVKQRLIKSTKGNMVILNDSDDKPGIILLGSSSAFIMVDDQSGDEQIVLKDAKRNNSIEIHSQDQSIHILCQGPAFIKAQQDITIETAANLKANVQGNADVSVTGNLTAEANGSMTLKAMGNINIEATGKLTLKGSQVEATSQTTMDVKGLTVNVDGTGTATVKGGMVNVNGTGPVSVSGMPIKLN